MVNYRCNAACRHCLYACSPSRKPGYINKEKIKEVCNLLIKGRIGSVHIGGGEPFLDFQGLITVVRYLANTGVRLDYIETNAFWVNDPKANEYIKTLINEGVDALCISIDPFHAEYVPWGFPLDLAEKCNKHGLGYFLWKPEYIRQLSKLDRNKRHSHDDLKSALGEDYIGRTAASYGIGFSGRAINIEDEFFKPKSHDPDRTDSHDSANSIKGLLDTEPCENLLSTGHFHIDLDGFFIPPGCTGLRLPLEELLEGTQTAKYPVYEALYKGGITALYKFALEQGFIPQKKAYPSKCNLCFYIRKYLSSAAGKSSSYAKMHLAELDDEFYKEALGHY